MILILTKGYVYMELQKDFVEIASHLSQINVCWQPEEKCAATAHLSYLTVSSSVTQKRKGLKGSVDLEKIRCVETVQPETNSPQERMYAFQVDIFVHLLL